MRTLTVGCTFATPAITSQVRYDRDGPLPRPPELRGQFRWAFRAVAASFLDGDGLRRVEAEFWGGRPSEGKDLRPSPVSVRLRRGVGEDDVEEGGRCARRRRRYRITIDEDGRLRVDNRCYLCPPIYLRGRREEQPLVIRAGATFELELTGLREDALEVAKLSLELLSLIGGYGRRFRRAFGCFEVRADDLSTRVEGTDDFVDRLRGCLDDLRELIAERSDGTSGPVESFPSFRRATLWTFEWRKQRVDKLLDRLGGTLREARRRLRNERFENSNEELRWLLGSSDAGGPWLLRSPLLLSVTPVELDGVNRGRYVVSVLLLWLGKLHPGNGTVVVEEGDRKRVENALERTLRRSFRGVERHGIEVTESRVRVSKSAG